MLFEDALQHFSNEETILAEEPGAQDEVRIKDCEEVVQSSLLESHLLSSIYTTYDYQVFSSNLLNDDSDDEFGNSSPLTIDDHSYCSQINIPKNVEIENFQKLHLNKSLNEINGVQDKNSQVNYANATKNNNSDCININNVDNLPSLRFSEFFPEPNCIDNATEMLTDDNFSTDVRTLCIKKGTDLSMFQISKFGLKNYLVKDGATLTLNFNMSNKDQFELRLTYSNFFNMSLIIPYFEFSRNDIFKRNCIKRIPDYFNDFINKYILYPYKSNKNILQSLEKVLDSSSQSKIKDLLYLIKSNTKSNTKSEFSSCILRILSNLFLSVYNDNQDNQVDNENLTKSVWSCNLPQQEYNFENSEDPDLPIEEILIEDTNIDLGSFVKDELIEDTSCEKLDVQNEIDDEILCEDANIDLSSFIEDELIKEVSFEDIDMHSEVINEIADDSRIEEKDFNQTIFKEEFDSQLDVHQKEIYDVQQSSISESECNISTSSDSNLDELKIVFHTQNNENNVDTNSSESDHDYSLCSVDEVDNSIENFQENQSFITTKEKSSEFEIRYHHDYCLPKAYYSIENTSDEYDSISDDDSILSFLSDDNEYHNSNEFDLNDESNSWEYIKVDPLLFDTTEIRKDRNKLSLFIKLMNEYVLPQNLNLPLELFENIYSDINYKQHEIIKKSYNKDIENLKLKKRKENMGKDLFNNGLLKNNTSSLYKSIKENIPPHHRHPIVKLSKCLPSCAKITKSNQCNKRNSFYEDEGEKLIKRRKICDETNVIIEVSVFFIWFFK